MGDFRDRSPRMRKGDGVGYRNGGKKKNTDVKTSAYHVGPTLTEVILVFPLYSSDTIHRLPRVGGGGGGGGEQGGALLPAEKPKWRGRNRHFK